MFRNLKSKFNYKALREAGYTEKFIKNLKYVGKTFLISGSLFLGIGIIVVIISNNQSFLRYLVNVYEAPILIIGIFLLGGSQGLYFLSSNVLIRIVGVIMLLLFWFQIFLSINFGNIFPILKILVFGGIAIYIYIILSVARLLFGEMKKSGHWGKKD